MRRSVLVVFLLLTCLQCFVVLAQRPNIVWITIEDTSPDFIGCYGNKEVRTPNIDALAREGVRFTEAYSTNVVCSPSRHTIITGVRTAQDGCGNHRSTMAIPSYVKGFASYLKQAGYFTSNNSKTDYNIADPKSFIAENWTQQGNKASFENRTDKSQPFFSIFNFNESHQSRTVGNSTAWYEKEILSQLTADEIIKPGNLTVPPFYKNSSENKENIARLYNALRVTDKRVGEIIERIKKEGEWDNTILFFYGDHGQGMPRFKTNAGRLGSHIPFIVRIPQKFQSLFPYAAGSTYSQQVSFEDLAPTMLNIATGEKPPAYMLGRIFMGADRTSPLTAYWGNRDNTDEVIDMGRFVIDSEFVYTRIFYPHLPVLQYQAYYERSPMLVQMRRNEADGVFDSLQASIFKPRSPEYLFSRKNDRWETVNLATDKKYAVVLAKMRAQNEAFMLRYADLGLLPEVVLAQINATDTLLKWKQAHYDAGKYLRVAQTVGMGAQHLQQQLKWLNDADSVVRYWAVIGLRNQAKEKLNKGLLQQALKSELSLLVKIELASVLHDLFAEKQQVQWLVDVVSTNNNPWIIRQAAMKLANIRDHSPETIQRVTEIRSRFSRENFKGLGYPIRAALGTVIHAQAEDDN